MRRVSKSSMAVMVATLLLGMLVGVVWARPNDRPQAADTTRKVTIPAAVFIPTSNDHAWVNGFDRVSCDSNTPKCSWAAPVVFPCLPAVTVERIKLHLYDHSTSDQACAALYRSKPDKKKTVLLGSVCSDSTGTTSNPVTLVSGAIYKVVWPSQGAMVWLVLGTNMEVYGVTVEYHRNI